MGWWSATILGGDTPYDYRGDFIDLMECGNDIEGRHFWFQGYKIETYRKKFEKNFDKIYKHARRHNDEEDGVPGQVLGVLILELGAKMPDNVRKFIIKSAKLDDWDRDNEERNKYIDDLIEKVKAYPKEGGTIVQVAQEGLYQKIHEAIVNGATGPINKNT